ncbi:MAG: HlyC/CorC family transporter [Syntrophobacterales bacterium]|nr:MAG: HlyC/CorC family transporter [Syntrophobacterales bacterium]
MSNIAALFRRFFRNRKPSLSERDIQSIIDVGEEEGVIDQEEHEMIHGIFELKQSVVREVMVPRTDVKCVSSEATVKDIIDLIISKGHSRIPVFKGKIDNIVGVVYAKDLLKFWGKDGEEIPLERVMRQPYFIPETKRLEELLKEFKMKRVHMAIVVDEYGGLSGLVTIEDLIEEVFGEIEDEYDQRVEGRIITLGDGSVSVDSKLEIEKLENHFDVEIQKENFETVGGFVFHLLGRVPKVGERVHFGDLIMTIESADGRRIGRVKITRSRGNLKIHN